MPIKILHWELSTLHDLPRAVQRVLVARYERSQFPVTMQSGGNGQIRTGDRDLMRVQPYRLATLPKVVGPVRNLTDLVSLKRGVHQRQCLGPVNSSPNIFSSVERADTWQAPRELNPHKRVQSALCYRYIRSQVAGTLGIEPRPRVSKTQALPLCNIPKKRGPDL
jgi:hypothetical protein